MSGVKWLNFNTQSNKVFSWRQPETSVNFAASSNAKISTSTPVAKLLIICRRQNVLTQENHPYPWSELYFCRNHFLLEVSGLSLWYQIAHLPSATSNQKLNYSWRAYIHSCMCKGINKIHFGSWNAYQLKSIMIAMKVTKKTVISETLSKVEILRPSSDAVLHMSRIECKWGRTKDFAHLHSIRLMWSTASELGLRQLIKALFLKQYFGLALISFFKNLLCLLHHNFKV